MGTIWCRCTSFLEYLSGVRFTVNIVTSYSEVCLRGCRSVRIAGVVWSSLSLQQLFMIDLGGGGSLREKLKDTHTCATSREARDTGKHHYRLHTVLLILLLYYLPLLLLHCGILVRYYCCCSFTAQCITEIRKFHQCSDTLLVWSFLATD